MTVFFTGNNDIAEQDIDIHIHRGQESNGLVRIVCIQHRVTEVFQAAHGKTAHIPVIFHDQNGFSPARDIIRYLLRAFKIRRWYRFRQQQFDHCTHTGCAFNLQVAACLLDKVVYHTQAQAAALAFGFGCEKGFTGAGERLLIHTATVIINTNRN